MKNDCVFCAIAAGAIPSFKVYEDELVVAYLDINPFTKGQTLVQIRPEKDSPESEAQKFFTGSQDKTVAGKSLIKGSM